MKVKWEEPVEYAQAVARSQGRVSSCAHRALIAVVVAVAVVLLAWGFESFFSWRHKKDLGVPTYFYIVAPLLAGLFIYFLPVMASVIPRTIVLDDQGVFRLKPLGTNINREFWPWESIATLTIEDQEVLSRVFPVLVIRGHDPRAEVALGLGNASLSDLSLIAEQNGKPLIQGQPR